jgi:transmembrane sensor
MKILPRRRLASFLGPGVDDARIERTWEALLASHRPNQFTSNGAGLWRARPLRWIVPIAAIGLLVVLSALLVRSRETSLVVPGMVIESGLDQTVTLSDGTRATLHEGAKLRWDRVEASRAEATVERGHVAFDVRHDAARRFVVHAAGMDIVDRGTRFSIDVEAGVLSVSVETGRVDVEGGRIGRIALSDGEAWTSRRSADDSQGPLSPVHSDAGPPRESSSNGDPPPETHPERRAMGSQELLQLANEARVAGRVKDAATAFDTLRRRYRKDPRAGLAAFELGRLRLDSLGDPLGAVEALLDAISLAPEATFREDADARLIEAYDEAHDPRCHVARQDYLARYQKGVHAAAVAARCP